MSDPDDLTPEQDDAVRALLAAARHTDPTPPEVVARLDATLAELRAETAAAHPVVDLAARRRRQRAASFVLAAAAVVVVGVGVTQVLPRDGGDEATSASAGSNAASDAGSALESAPAPSEAAPYSSDAQAEEPSSRTAATLPMLNSQAPLRPQVRELRDLATPTAATFAACAGIEPAPDSGGDPFVDVFFDGEPAAVVFHPPAAGAQQVSVFVCGESAPVRTVTLRAR